MRSEVERILEMIRPALQRDGGDIELVDVSDEGTVTVRLQGACDGCAMASLTLQMGVEQILKSELPQVKEVVAV